MGNKEDILLAQLQNAIILENIRVLCVRNKTSIPKVEKALGYGNGSVSGWSKAKKQAPADRVKAIADYFNVAIESLLNEDGALYALPASAHNTSEVAVVNDSDQLTMRISALDTHGRDAILALLACEEARMALDAETKEENSEKVVKLIRHYFSSPAAGVGGMEAGEDYEDVPLPDDAPQNADYCLTVSGDSMEPYIADGSMVYVMKDAGIDDFDVGIFLVDGVTYIKQFCRGYGGVIYLLSANPKREDANITIHPDGNQRFEYYGKVIVKKKLPHPIYG